MFFSLRSVNYFFGSTIQAEKLMFLLRKRKCLLDSRREGYHTEKPENTIFYFDNSMYLDTTRCHDGTQTFLKRKFDTSALKWRVTRFFWKARKKLFRKTNFKKDAK